MDRRRVLRLARLARQQGGGGSGGNWGNGGDLDDLRREARGAFDWLQDLLSNPLWLGLIVFGAFLLVVLVVAMTWVSSRGKFVFLDNVVFKTAQAMAAMRGRDHVIPDEVKYLAPFTLAHRLIVKPEAELRGQTAVEIVGDILERTPLSLEA